MLNSSGPLPVSQDWILKQLAKTGLGPKSDTKWCPHDPTPAQQRFLDCGAVEALYGGAAGGGKTDALLQAALRHVDTPGYAALILRRTFAQLAKADGPVQRAHEWLQGTPAVWNELKHRWTFPSGATLEFGHLQHDKDKYNYQGAAYQFIGFDELTQFDESHYRYLFSRLRRLQGSPVTVQVLSASNPGGRGHEWVKRAFITHPETRVFVPAKLADNPHLDREGYTQSLMRLSPLEREQLLSGSWDAVADGDFFKREWFPIVDVVPFNTQWVRFWDMAATTTDEGRDPDWTVGALVGLSEQGRWYIKDIKRLRGRPDEVENLIKQTARLDGRQVKVAMEQEPGSSGKVVIDHYRRRVLVGYAFEGIRSTGDKATRAAPMASAAEAGNMALVDGAWVSDFLDEAGAFPQGSHDDQVDAVSGAFDVLGGQPASFRITTFDRSGRRDIVRGLNQVY